MRIASWNINGGFGLADFDSELYLGQENLDYFIAQLELINADIVCLQEVHVNDSCSQAQELSEALGLEHVFLTVASDSHVDPIYKLCNAVLAKYPFTKTQSLKHPKPKFSLDLPLLENGSYATVHDKFTQLVEFEDFTLANTHAIPLNFLGGSYQTVEGQVFAKEVEDLWLEHLQAPVIFCGDFNQANIQSLFPRLFKTFGLHDALPRGRSSLFAKERIDYILLSEGFQVKTSQLVKTKTDHFLCWLDAM